MTSSAHVPHVLIMIFLILLSIFSTNANEAKEVAIPIEMMMNKKMDRRKLEGGYQTCSMCTCCGAKGVCLSTPCCYALICNIPNKPPGTCSLVPKSCNCFGC